MDNNFNLRSKAYLITILLTFLALIFGVVGATIFLTWVLKFRSIGSINGISDETLGYSNPDTDLVTYYISLLIQLINFSIMVISYKTLKSEYRHIHTMIPPDIYGGCNPDKGKNKVYLGHYKNNTGYISNNNSGPDLHGTYVQAGGAAMNDNGSDKSDRKVILGSTQPISYI